MKQLFIIKTNFVKLGCAVSDGHFPIVPRNKMSFVRNSIRKNHFLRACFFWYSRLSLLEMDQRCNLVEPLVVLTRTWSFYFVTLKYLDYTQNYKMLLKQCGYIVAKIQTTVT